MTRRAAAGPAGDAVVVLGAFLGAGLVAGVLWWLLADPPRYTVTRQGPRMGEVQLAAQFSVDGWYAVLGIVLGGLTGILLAWRRPDPLATTLLLVPGAVLAAVVARWTGGLLGPGDPRAALDRAAAGARVPVSLELSDNVFLLVWPIAALAGALMVLWSLTGPAPAPTTQPTTGEARTPDRSGPADIPDPHHGRSPSP